MSAPPWERHTQSDTLQRWYHFNNIIRIQMQSCCCCKQLCAEWRPNAHRLHFTTAEAAAAAHKRSRLPRMRQTQWSRKHTRGRAFALVCVCYAQTCARTRLHINIAVAAAAAVCFRSLLLVSVGIEKKMFDAKSTCCACFYVVCDDTCE